MDKIDKIPLKGNKRRVVNPKVVTADDHNDLIEGVNILIDEVVILQASEDALTSDVVDALVLANEPSMSNTFLTQADVPEVVLTEDELDAINGANNPSAGNAFATMDDIPVVETVLTEDEVMAIKNSNGADGSNFFLTVVDLEIVPSYMIYNKYAAFLTQTGTNAPTETILERSNIGTPVWARTSTGVYTLTSVPGFFTANKTIPNSNPELYIDPVTGNKITAVRTSANVITLTTKNSSDVAIDDALTDRYFEVVVYK